MNGTVISSRVRSQKGFTLTELLAVLAIIGILAGLVAAFVGGSGEKSLQARLSADQTTIDASSGRFYTDSQPNVYPVVAYADTDPFLKPAQDLGVRLIDFDARLPQKPSDTFVSDYLKVVPDSASQVSWRVDTNTGIVFFAEDDAPLILPASPRFGVSAASATPGAVSDYDLDLDQKKDQAALDLLVVDIPAGYTVDTSVLASGDIVGTVAGSFAGNNPWAPGDIVTFSGDLKATGTVGQWDLVIKYSGAVDSSGTPVTVKGGSDRTHTVSVVASSGAIPGQLSVTLNQGSDPKNNEADESWKLTLNGTVGVNDIITNPATAAVYRWLADAHAVIDVAGSQSNVAGNQSVIIK